MPEVVRAVVQDKPRVEAGDQAERRPRRRIGHHDRTGTGYLPEVAQDARDEQIRVRPPEYSVGGRGGERRVHGEISLGLWFLSRAPGATNPREDLAQRLCGRTGVGEAGGLDEDGRIAGSGEEGGEGLVPLPEEIPPYTGEDHHRRPVHEGAYRSPTPRPSGRRRRRGLAWPLRRRGGRGRRGAGSRWFSPAGGCPHESATLPGKEPGRSSG